jgi:hypothetical protein
MIYYEFHIVLKDGTNKRVYICANDLESAFKGIKYKGAEVKTWEVL